jgi:phosphate:Na+ symporter
LAAYHTAYNVVGVAVLLPLIDWFTRVVERILPERASPLTRCLDRAALVTPIAAEEAVRRTVARSLGTMCGSIGAALMATNRGTSAFAGTNASVADAGNALRQALQFMSEASGPPASKEEQERLTSTLHALDHASRLAEVASEKDEVGSLPGGSEDVRAAELCVEAMRNAALIAGQVGALPSEVPEEEKEVAANAAPTDHAAAQLEQCAKALHELQLAHRKGTLSSVAGGAVSADAAIARVDTLRRLEALARHAWRSAAYLVEGRA